MEVIFDVDRDRTNVEEQEVIDDEDDQAIENLCGCGWNGK